MLPLLLNRVLACVILSPSLPLPCIRYKSAQSGVTEMRSLLQHLTFAFALTLLFLVGHTEAQQNATGRQKAPRLTTDDVRPPAEQPAVESKDPLKLDTVKGEGSAKADGTDPKADQTKTSSAKLSPEESAWRNQVAKAREKAKRLEKEAEEAELRITRLRNDLGTPGQSPRERNDTAAELGQSGQHLTELRTEARAAAEDADQLTDYGKQKGFNEAPEKSSTTEDGKPNEDYYRSQFVKLNETLETAQRRVQLYDNRVRDLNQQISSNSGARDSKGRATGGDNFYAMQLQKDLDSAQQQLQDARFSLTKAQNDLDALREDARRAGVPPGALR